MSQTNEKLSRKTVLTIASIALVVGVVGGIVAIVAITQNSSSESNNADRKGRGDEVDIILAKRLSNFHFNNHADYLSYNESAHTLDANQINMNSNDVYNALGVENGGTGSDTIVGARNVLSVGVTTTGSGSYLTADTSNNVLKVQPVNLSFRSVDITGTLSVDNGGTGSTTNDDARKSLSIPVTLAENSKKYVSVDSDTNVLQTIDINLSSEVKGVLSVEHGGTGCSNLPSLCEALLMDRRSVCWKVPGNYSFMPPQNAFNFRCVVVGGGNGGDRSEYGSNDFLGGNGGVGASASILRFTTWPSLLAMSLVVGKGGDATETVTDSVDTIPAAYGGVGTSSSLSFGSTVAAVSSTTIASISGGKGASDVTSYGGSSILASLSSAGIDEITITLSNGGTPTNIATDGIGGGGGGSGGGQGGSSIIAGADGKVGGGGGGSGTHQDLTNPAQTLYNCSASGRGGDGVVYITYDLVGKYDD